MKEFEDHCSNLWCQFNFIQMNFIGMRKHMFALPKQVSHIASITIVSVRFRLWLGIGLRLALFHFCRLSYIIVFVFSL